jgi:hypothetical protein
VAIRFRNWFSKLLGSINFTPVTLIAVISYRRRYIGPPIAIDNSSSSFCRMAGACGSIGRQSTVNLHWISGVRQYFRFDAILVRDVCLDGGAVLFWGQTWRQMCTSRRYLMFPPPWRDVDIAHRTMPLRIFVPRSDMNSVTHLSIWLLGQTCRRRPSNSAGRSS